MKFTPTRSMRYAAALKNLTAKDIFCNGLTQRNRENLKKIILFEAAYCNRDCKQSVNLRSLTDSLFGAAYILCTARGVRLRTTLSSHICGRINIRLYEILLGTAVSALSKGDAAILSFSGQRGGVRLCIISKRPPKIALAALSALNATVLRVLNPCKTAVFIPIERSNESDTEPLTELDCLVDRFSVFRLFASDSVTTNANYQ